ncbi:MAG: DUF4430 domain-containing protein [Collinsella aerofaciens]
MSSKANRGLVLDYRHRCRRQGSDLGGAYAAQARRGRDGCGCLHSCRRRRASRRSTIRHGIRFLPRKHHLPSDGRTLAYDPATHAYWQLFVDGASSSVGASSVKLTQGQKIEFAFTGGSASPVVKDQLAANVTVIGRDAQGKTQTGRQRAVCGDVRFERA